MPEVAAISGHRFLRMPMRYTHPKPEAIAVKLGPTKDLMLIEGLR